MGCQLQPPEPFDFKSNWPKRRCFQQYRDASGLGEESNTRQVSMLLYCLEEEANDVLTSTNILKWTRSYSLKSWRKYATM